MKHRIIWMILFITLLLTVFMLRYYNTRNKEVVKLNYIKSCFDNRACYYFEEGMLVGNNTKELQNGFYDFKVQNTENGLKLVVNKLWYKKFNESLYEDEYVKVLYNYIVKILEKNQSVNEADKYEIYHNLIEGYSKAKNNIEYMYEITINNIKLTFHTINYELVLNMEVL